LVATPIGNAADVTLRALDVLERAEILAAEDTRRTRKLMDLHGISLRDRPMVSYHDQNGSARRPQILKWLADGRSVAYASDAGTPLIADPGYKLVESAQEAGYRVHAVPGASSVLAALSVAGLPTDRFLFLGFLPTKAGARSRELQRWAATEATLVIFESPRRLGATLAEMAEVFDSARPAVVTRELTKKFEEVCRGSIAELAEVYSIQTAPKGEIVIVIGPPKEGTSAPRTEDVDTAIRSALEHHSLKEAAKLVSENLGLAKRDVYNRALRLKDD
jgi:16S rRNA (cytidine1402-2'-O)-methyltransferase